MSRKIVMELRWKPSLWALFSAPHGQHRHRRPKICIQKWLRLISTLCRTLMDRAVWGANMPKSPVYLNPQFEGQPEPIDVFMVLTGTWSDGTPAPLS